MPAIIPDFTEADLQLVSSLLQERYGKPMSPEVADSELRLDPANDELTVCPTYYWSERGAPRVSRVSLKPQEARRRSPRELS